jgi:hypothetical protein
METWMLAIVDARAGFEILKLHRGSKDESQIKLMGRGVHESRGGEQAERRHNQHTLQLHRRLTLCKHTSPFERISSEYSS